MKKQKKYISRLLNLIPVPQLAKANPQINSSVPMSMLKDKSPSNDGQIYQTFYGDCETSL